MYKMLDGELVQMSLEEEQAHLAAMPKPDFKKLIREERDKALFGGIEVNGMLVHTDDVSQQRIVGATVATLFNQTMKVQWKTMDGKFVELTAQEIVGLAQIMRQHVQDCYNNEAALLEELAGMTEPVTLNVKKNWPKRNKTGE